MYEPVNLFGRNMSGDTTLVIYMLVSCVYNTVTHCVTAIHFQTVSEFRWVLLGNSSHFNSSNMSGLQKGNQTGHV